MTKTVTVILNGYKRNHLKEQVEAIDKQTHPVEEIFYWQNTVDGFAYDEDTYSNLNSVLSTISLLTQHEFKFDGETCTIF